MEIDRPEIYTTHELAGTKKNAVLLSSSPPLESEPLSMKTTQQVQHAAFPRRRFSAQLRRSALGAH